MAETAEREIQVDTSLLEQAQAAAEAAFGVPLSFWVDPTQWTEVSIEGGILRQLNPEREPLLARLLADAIDARQPVTSTDTSPSVCIPLSVRANSAVVAVARIEGVDPALLPRLAEWFLRDFLQQQELTSLRHENQAFLRQVTNDFEELTFLRGMAELLEISDLSFDFIAMAETVLPTLKPLLEADALVLVTATQTAENQVPAVDEPQVGGGLRPMEESVCCELVEAYRDQCELQPVVKNYFDQTPEGPDFPGVTGFILVPIVNGEQLIGWLVALNRNNERNINTEELPWEVSYLEFGTHEATLMSSSAAILATHSRNVELFREREELLVSVVRALVSAIEAKDEYTRGHSERVALYGRRLAEAMGLSEDYCERLYLTGLLHDVGKIGVRDAVLRKPGPLTDEEFEEIKQHPDKGWAILQDLAPLGYVLPGVLHHHENYNGRGYPDSLAGEAIPLDGRILAVADAYDAMTSDRPYRPGMPQEKAEAILRGGAGDQWDAELIDMFFRIMPDIIKIKRTYRPREPVQRKPRTTAQQTAATDRGDPELSSIPGRP